ncbi:40003_t:CDS:2 [Gigaspora margarita]|uniref:40003_t:CDS:1 n=1 Tax=Gigaspora margarita TaxID=4874 RepID=A0ABN7VRJ3_GIGMA|nr:40003_t:CDS:2 [Gigaspora margarita]
MTKKNNKRSLNETEKFSEENLAKCTLTKKTDKTRNPFASITNDREDSIINNVFRSRRNTRRPLQSIQNEVVTGSSPDKKKGSGLGVLISEKIQKHKGNFQRHNEYLLEFHIISKHLKLNILIVYLPPNDPKQATTENWEEYKLSLQYFLSKRTSSLDTLNKDINKISQKDIDNIWVSIESGILYAAKHNIPFRRIPNSMKKALSTNRKTKSPLQKDTISISKIC